MDLNRQIEVLTKRNALMRALLTHMPAMVFAKDAETGVYLACNQPFAEYAHKEGPDGVVGLTDYEIFDPVTAAHFTQDDRIALSMDEPHVFIEDVPDAAGNPRHFQTTKVKFCDESGRMCTLGLCVDVTVMTRLKTEKAENRVKEEESSRHRGLQQRLHKEEKQRLEQMIRGYILGRHQLVNVFVLVDVRLEPQPIDLEFMNWLGVSSVPFSIIFTKADKLSSAKVTQNVEAYKQRMLEEWEELPPMFITSSDKGTGRDEVLDYIESINKDLKQTP